MKARQIILALCAAAAVPAHAFEVRPLLKAGFDFGGDTITTAVFTNGDTETIKANEGLYVGGGAAIINDAKDMEFHVTLAYKFALINADNGDIEWTRWPIEALAFYRWSRVRAGGGLAYHVNPQLDGSGVASNIDVKFKDAFGLVLQVDWRITEKIALGGRYTALKYEAKAPASGSAKTNGVGVAFSMNF
ncbi:MAG: outer membrane beta-barrel protein [Burkholderiales bacterium]